jgi:hypothetical protein
VVLVTLGGCHLLDGLVARPRPEARKKIVWCSGEMIVRGIVLVPLEPQRATIVKCVIECPHLVEVLTVPKCWARLVNAY